MSAFQILNDAALINPNRLLSGLFVDIFYRQYFMNKHECNFRKLIFEEFRVLLKIEIEIKAKDPRIHEFLPTA